MSNAGDGKKATLKLAVKMVEIFTLKCILWAASDMFVLTFGF